MVCTNNKIVVGDPNVMVKKKTKGRMKIEMKKIQENSRLQVAFSKRRNGLFKKASELCVLTGAQIGILVTSPAGGRVYSFGCPNVDLIIDRYLKSINLQETQIPQNYPSTTSNDFDRQDHCVAVSTDLEREVVPWYDAPIDGMNLGELEDYLVALEDLKKSMP